MPDQTRPPAGVFLSYASQDAEPARRLCEALRAAGVEVWFDQSELRGGDAWDAKIKKQIRECALFLPIISAHTNARTEGYFRREWNLATQRLLDIAHDAAFVVPVVIDETRDTEARVPDEFLRVQWTRLPGGDTPPAFVQRIRKLLAADTPVVSREPIAASGTIERRSVPRRPWLVPAIAGLTGALALALWQPWRPAEKPVAAPVPSALVSPPDPHSIAVLPFVDMSASKDQEYMSDGLAEELLNLLTKVPALHVTSRTSAFSFKGQNVEVPEIARRLNVAHVLEGSVRKSGSRLRITAQLIDARSDQHLWSDTYDRTLDDVFAVQDEIAAAVVAQLKIKLLGAAPKSRTTDPKAYALFLQARQLSREGTAKGLEQSIAVYQQALAIDPGYAAACVGLAANYLSQANKGLRPIDESYGLAREMINKALAIDPDFAPAYTALSRIASDYDDDLATAARHLEHAQALEPTSLEVIGAASALVQSLGRLDQAIALDKYAVAHDPLNPKSHGSLAYDYFRSGHLDEGISSYQTALSLSPGRVGTRYNIGELLLRKGENTAALAEMQQEPEEIWRLMGLTMAWHALGKRADSDAALAQLISKYEKDCAYNVAYVLAFRGESDRAFEWLDKAVAYHDTGLVEIGNDPMFDNIRRDPRWLPFLRKIGKAPEQLAAIKFDVKLPPQ